MIRYKDTKYFLTEDGGVFNSESGKYLKGIRNKNGYLSITLSHKNVKTQHLVHRLIANAYLPNPKGYPNVNHIDGNKHNNSIDNLEWISQRDNVIHAYKLGLAVSVKGEKVGSSKLTEEDVLTVRKLHKDGYSIGKLSRMNNVGVSCIHQIVHRKTWKHI
ncbi:HNH endonuclease [Bacillus cereus group sp. TH153LC]|uniref:HNH endonuclease n=1 Tax=Bacillus cereus group sp. TH153LC TaxID=3018059 RepID=UPI0034DD69CC